MSDPQNNPTNGNDRRREALAEVENCVCRDRNNTYGDAEDEFGRVATVWSTLFKTELKPEDVALALAALKIVRASSNRGHRDNWIDMAGYAVCGAGIMAAKVTTEKE